MLASFTFYVSSLQNKREDTVIYPAVCDELVDSSPGTSAHFKVIAMLPPQVFDELLDFVADNAAPTKLITYHSSGEPRERCSDLLFREKYEGLSPDETKELDAFGSLGHVMLRAKARAHRWVSEPRIHQQ